MTNLYEHAIGLLQGWKDERHDLDDLGTVEDALRWFVTCRKIAGIEEAGEIIEYFHKHDWTAGKDWTDKMVEMALDADAGFDDVEGMENYLAEFFGID